MGPSEKSFNQVKNILGKLDRSIDQIRNQRTAPPTPMHSSAEATRPAPTPQAQAPRATSAFGRATPIPPTN
ncbi:MAG: hypothetical protein WCK33_12220 [Phycisphaerae bacterium]|jgi:hypothetical protein